jgi:hypothetical protein
MRNLRVHERVALHSVSLAPHILEEARRWARVGFVGIGSLGRRRVFLVLFFVLFFSPLCSVITVSRLFLMKTCYAHLKKNKKQRCFKKK